MREMKDSGIAWLGDIPISWSVVYPKALFSQRKERAFDGDRQLTASQQYGVVYQDEYMETTGSRVVVVQKDFDILKHVEAGDFVISMRSFQGGIEYSENTGCISSAYVMLKPNSKLVYPNFYKWLLKSVTYINALQSTSNLVRDGQAMRFANFIQVSLPVAPIDEQQRIADMLNGKCLQIDALLSNVQTQIEKLKQYKQSLITEVVTKGLDPTVPMKDSGIEWIGEIPEHWSAIPINALFRIKKDIIGREPDCVLSITQQGIKVKDISVNEGQMAANYDKYQSVNVGDFAMNHMDLLTGGVGISEYEGVTSPDYRVFVLRDTAMNPRFFLNVFLMYYRNRIFYAFGQGAANVGRWRLPAQNFKTTCIPLAPIDEQNEIAGYLDERFERIDRLISIKQSKIEKLNAYKKSLIYEYVTGKKEAI